MLAIVVLHWQVEDKFEVTRSQINHHTSAFKKYQLVIGEYALPFDG